MISVVPDRRRTPVGRVQSVRRQARERVLRNRTREHPQEAEVIIASLTDEEKRAADRAVCEVSPALQEGEVLTLVG